MLVLKFHDKSKNNEKLVGRSYRKRPDLSLQKVPKDKVLKWTRDLPSVTLK